jgi:nicotinamide-nucleotide amidase
VQSLFARRNQPTPHTNRNQALVPKGFAILRNDMGTAPGLHYQKQGKSFFALPGVPMEMQWLFETHIRKILGGDYQNKPLIVCNIHTWGISESLLAEKLESFPWPLEIKHAWLPQTGRVDLRLYGTDESLIEQTRIALIKEIGEYFWATDAQSPAWKLGQLLRTKAIKLLWRNPAQGLDGRDAYRDTG